MESYTLLTIAELACAIGKSIISATTTLFDFEIEYNTASATSLGFKGVNPS